MDVVIVAIVLVALTAFVAAPLYTPSAPNAAVGDPSIQARHEALVRALRELEVDHASGLLPDGDYERERAALEREAEDTLGEPST
jgi:hypothetical protein